MDARWPRNLTSDYVFAESFGIQDDYRQIFKGNYDVVKKLSRFDNRMLALYKDGHKFLFNINGTSVVSDENLPFPKEIDNIILEFLGPKYKIEEPW